MLHEHDGADENCETRRREDAAPQILAPDPLRPRAKPRTGGGLGQHAPDAYRTRDVLDFLLARVLVAQPEFVPYLLVDSTRDTDAAGVGEAFEARGDVDAIAVDL